MTSISGYDLKITQCCGSVYRSPRFRSINFSAWEHWTDGYPPYELSKEQRENLTALLRLAESDDSVLNNETLVELYRELGEFETAAEALCRILEKDRDVTTDLIGKLINEKECAPMRYRI